MHENFRIPGEKIARSTRGKLGEFFRRPCENFRRAGEISRLSIFDWKNGTAKKSTGRQKNPPAQQKIPPNFHQANFDLACKKIHRIFTSSPAADFKKPAKKIRADFTTASALL